MREWIEDGENMHAQLKDSTGEIVEAIQEATSDSGHINADFLGDLMCYILHSMHNAHIDLCKEEEYEHDAQCASDIIDAGNRDGC
jgi:NTP pyrophosphatase (non-canonical NTP hydrolase)